MKIDPNFVILYVKSAVTSAAFYESLLDRKPIQTAPDFAMFRTDTGLLLGLWTRDTVEPAAALAGGGAELCIPVLNIEELEAVYVAWQQRKLPILQPPTEMDFGRTFVAADPDGHRLRVFVRSAP